MPPGDVLWNPLTGEKALLVESPEENGGARIVVDFAVEAGGFVPGGEHLHDRISEHFDVDAGTVELTLAGERRLLGPGEAATVPPGTWHHWRNAGAGELRMRVRIEPALRFAELIATLWGLCADGHTDARGRPSPLYGALLLTRYRDEIRLRRPPRLVQRLVFPPLAALARRRGLERALDRYLTAETHPSARESLGRLPERVVEPRPRRRRDAAVPR